MTPDTNTTVTLSITIRISHLQHRRIDLLILSTGTSPFTTSTREPSPTSAAFVTDAGNAITSAARPDANPLEKPKRTAQLSCFAFKAPHIADGPRVLQAPVHAGQPASARAHGDGDLLQGPDAVQHSPYTFGLCSASTLEAT